MKKNLKKTSIWQAGTLIVALWVLPACLTTGGTVAPITNHEPNEIAKAGVETGGIEKTVVENGTEIKEIEGLKESEIEIIEEIKEKKEEQEPLGLKTVIEKTTNYSVTEYLRLNPDANNRTALDFTVGGYDIVDISVYGEPNLDRQNVRISADGYISFPFIGRLKVAGLSTSEIESLISRELAERQYLLDAHVSVSVREYNSKRFHVLGSVKSPGVYPLKGKERVLDAISRAGGIDQQAGREAMIVRTNNPDTNEARKIVIRLDLNELLKLGNQVSNLLLDDQDLLFIPKALSFNIIGQVKNPGSYPYIEKEITLVQAISMAGGFTPIAARNRTRIVRTENGQDRIIKIKVDDITEAGKKELDILVLPGDVIVVPESFF